MQVSWRLSTTVVWVPVAKTWRKQHSLPKAIQYNKSTIAYLVLLPHVLKQTINKRFPKCRRRVPNNLIRNDPRADDYSLVQPTLTIRDRHLNQRLPNEHWRENERLSREEQKWCRLLVSAAVSLLAYSCTNRQERFTREGTQHTGILCIYSREINGVTYVELCRVDNKKKSW